MRKRLVILGAAAAALAGCGDAARSLPGACTDSPVSTVERALTAAPSPVLLAGRVRLSDCVAIASDRASLETVGFVVTSTADDLAARAPRDPAAPLELGYLIGAVRRGGSHVNGVAAELIRRVENAGATLGSPASLASLHAGIQAGQVGG